MAPSLAPALVLSGALLAAAPAPAAPEGESSAMVAPLYLGLAPPELRAARAILIVHSDVPGVTRALERTREQAAALAAEVSERLAAGADFAQLAREHSAHPSAEHGGVLGSFWPGMLRAEADRFLFSAELGERSPPIESEIGFEILERIDARAGCLHILLQGDRQAERAAELLAALAAGADFRELARTHSDDPLGRERSGAHAIFVRGPTDAVLKAAIFEAAVGQVVGPLESPLGTSIARRVAPEELDPALTDAVIVRARAIFLQEQPGRDLERCEAFANELAERIRAGEDMAALARAADDDPGGRERSGDLGWILRRSSKTWPVVERVFLVAPGELVGPLKLSRGFLLLRRER